MTSNLNDINLLYDELSRLTPIDLCIQAQEIIQDLIFKIADLNSIIKTTLQAASQYDPNNTFNLRKIKLEETLTNTDLTFQRLRTICKLVNQKKSLLDHSPKQPSDQVEQYEGLKTSLENQIRNRNCYFRLAIESLTNIVWEINTIHSTKWTAWYGWIWIRHRLNWISCGRILIKLNWANKDFRLLPIVAVCSASNAIQMAYGWICLCVIDRSSSRTTWTARRRAVSILAAFGACWAWPNQTATISWVSFDPLIDLLSPNFRFIKPMCFCWKAQWFYSLFPAA